MCVCVWWWGKFDLEKPLHKHAYLQHTFELMREREGHFAHHKSGEKCVDESEHEDLWDQVLHVAGHHTREEAGVTRHHLGGCVWALYRALVQVSSVLLAQKHGFPGGEGLGGQPVAHLFESLGAADDLQLAEHLLVHLVDRLVF